MSTFITNIALMGAFLLDKGILIRGGISYGNLIHDSNGIVFGQALIDAYKTESELAIYPRILLTKKLIEKLNYPIKSKSSLFPYNNYLSRFEDGCVGFDQLSFYEVIQSWDKLNKKQFVKNLKRAKTVIINGLDSCFDNPGVYCKYEWLKNRYNKLCILDNSDVNKIRELNEGIYGKNIHYSYTDDYYNKTKT